jgi:hypothetical protein
MVSKKFVSLVFGLVLFLFAFIACGSASVGTTTGGNVANPTNQRFALNEEVKAGDYVVTVTGIRAVAATSEFYKPEAGNKFIQIDVTVKNASNENKSFSDILFSIKDANGFKGEYRSGVGGTSVDGPLPAGDIVRGQIGYEVKADQTKFTLTFSPDFFSTFAVWDLSL